MLINILLVEDNRHKREKIIDILSDLEPDFIITEALSYTSGWKQLTSSSFNLILLDMSLPTFDICKTESGGKFRTYGGKELARKMKRRQIKTKFIFITQYESFNDLNGTQTLQSIEKELKIEYKEQCVGVIHFDTSSSLWKKALQNMICSGISKP